MTTSEPDPDPNQELLERLLSGELLVGDDEVQAAMRLDPAFAREVDALLRLSEDLGDAGVLGGAPEELDDGGARRALDEQALARMLDDASAVPRVVAPARRLYVLAAAAALLLAAVGVGLWWWGDDRPPIVSPDTVLGAGEMWPGERHGEVPFEEFVRLGFRWGPVDVAPGDRLTIVVTTDDPSLGPQRFTVVDVVIGAPPTSFPVPQALVEQRPGRMEWRLVRERIGWRDHTWDDSAVFVH